MALACWAGAQGILPSSLYAAIAPQRPKMFSPVFWSRLSLPSLPPIHKPPSSSLKHHEEPTKWGKRILLCYLPHIVLPFTFATFPWTSDNHFAATPNKTYSPYLPRQKLHKQGLSFLQWFFSFFFSLPFLFCLVLVFFLSFNSENYSDICFQQAQGISLVP